MKKLLIVQVAGLGYECAARHGAATLGGGCAIRPMQSVFPALTCTAQASLRTGLPPAQHGMTANGFFDVTLRKPMFSPSGSRSSRKKRIASGSGTAVVDINRLLKQFDMMQSMSKQMAKGKMPAFMGGGKIGKKGKKGFF